MANFWRSFEDSTNTLRIRSVVGRAAALRIVVVLALALGACAAPPAIPAERTHAPADSVVFSDFSALADGAPPKQFSSGQPVDIAPAAADAPGFEVVDGRLMIEPPAEGRQSAIMRTPDLGQPIVRIGMQWAFAAGAGGGSGVALLGITNKPLDEVEGAPVALQVLVGQDSWRLSLSPGSINGDPRMIAVADGVFATPLAADGTAFKLEVDLDGPVASVHLPDGTTRQVSDPRIAAWAGRVGFFGDYSEDGLTDSRAGLVRVWADT